MISEKSIRKIDKILNLTNEKQQKPCHTVFDKFSTMPQVMKFCFIFSIFMILICSFCNGENFDDVICDKQLKYFSDSLSKHERWALECEKISTRKNKSI